jgi:diguanylate cyclase (GGDEF)-like protein
LQQRGQELERQLNEASHQEAKLTVLLALAEELRESDPEVGLRYSDQAAILAEAMNDTASSAEAQVARGLILRGLAREQESIVALSRAIDLYQSIGDLGQLAHAHYHLGGTYGLHIELTKALTHIAIATDLFESLGDNYGRAKCLQGNACICQRAGRVDEAIELTRAAAALLQHLPGKEIDYGYALFNLSALLADKGSAEDTVDFLEEAVQIGRSAGSTRLIAYCLGQLGVAHAKSGALDRAHAAFKEALQQGSAVSDPVLVAWMNFHLAELSECTQDLDIAEQYYTTGSELAKQFDVSECLVQCLESRSRIAATRGHHDTALSLFMEFHARKMDLVQDSADRNLQKRLTQTELDRTKKEKELLSRAKIELEERVIERTRALSDAIDELHTEIEERRKAEAKIRVLAEQDYLTGTSNRVALFDRLRRQIASARNSSDKVYVIFIDLTRFKQINDSLGHHVGDHVLQQVANRLKQCANADILLSRYGGDEFVCVLSNGAQLADLHAFVSRVHGQFNRPFEAGSESVVLSCSIGVSCFPDHGLEAEDLIKHADLAMYSVKRHGKNNFAMFETDLLAATSERFAIEKHLRGILDRDELSLHYQPKINLVSGRIAGFEALLRWKSPTLGNIPPGKFIPLTEESGQIVEIGRWVIRQACQQIHEWRLLGLDNFSVAVNLSVRQLQDDNLVSDIRSALESWNLSPNYLEIEVTESILLDQPDRAATKLHALQQAGVSIALDDFGTGYSNMSYLGMLPINTVKIDRSFVRAMVNNPRDEAIVRAMILMAHSLGATVIAEGVEHQDQADLLRAHDCDQYQGWLFSAAQPAEKLIALIQSHFAADISSQAADRSNVVPFDSKAGRLR